MAGRAGLRLLLDRASGDPVRGARLVDRAPRRRLDQWTDDGFLHPGMDHADEEMLATGRHETERPEEERRRVAVPNRISHQSRTTDGPGEPYSR